MHIPDAVWYICRVFWKENKLLNKCLTQWVTSTYSREPYSIIFIMCTFTSYKVQTWESVDNFTKNGDFFEIYYFTGTCTGLRIAFLWTKPKSTSITPEKTMANIQPSWPQKLTHRLNDTASSYTKLQPVLKDFLFTRTTYQDGTKNYEPFIIILTFMGKWAKIQTKANSSRELTVKKAKICNYMYLNEWIM